MQEKMNQMLRLAQLHHATDIHFVMKKEKLSVSMRGLYGMEEIYSPAGCFFISLFEIFKQSGFRKSQCAPEWKFSVHV